MDLQNKASGQQTAINGIANNRFNSLRGFLPVSSIITCYCKEARKALENKWSSVAAN
jgi:hypothetical protein